MIKAFKHEGLEQFFTHVDVKGLQAAHGPRISRLLDAIDQAGQVEELNVPGWHLHRLKGEWRHLHGLRVSGNWRIAFQFIDGEAHIVHLEDYH